MWGLKSPLKGCWGVCSLFALSGLFGLTLLGFGLVLVLLGGVRSVGVLFLVERALFPGLDGLQFYSPLSPATSELEAKTLRKQAVGDNMAGRLPYGLRRVSINNKHIP